MYILLDVQINIYCFDTSDFYSNREKRLHTMNHKIRQEKRILVDGGFVARRDGKGKRKIIGLKDIERDLEDMGVFECDMHSILNGEYDFSDCEFDESHIKDLVERYFKIKDLVSIKNKKAKKIKDDLLLLLSNKVSHNKGENIRMLRDDSVSDGKVISVFDSYFTRTIGAKQNELCEDFMIVQVYYFDVIKDLIYNGFYYKGEKYVYFTSSAGQIRTKKTVFVKESVWKKYEKSIMCGLTIEDINAKGGNNPNKHLAYLALSNSATDVWREFDIDKTIVIDDFETEVFGTYDLVDEVEYTISRECGHQPITHTDGSGMMLPNAFGVPQKNKMVRLSWVKGLLGVFDFKKFIEKHGCSPVIKDIYGEEHDIIKEDIQVIFTKSQFKLWKYYSSWQSYKDNYKKYGCSAGFTNPEEDRIKNATINYQMLQSLTDIDDDEIEMIAGKSIRKLENLCSSVDNVKNAFYVTPYNTNKTAFQKCIDIYPELLNDDYAKSHLRRIKDSIVKKCKAGKLDVDGKYTFILPDFYAACEHWFLGIDSPNGLLDDGEVFCWLFRKSKELDCLRSPHLFCEHSIRNNVACREYGKRQEDVREWFCTDAIYTSCKDMISKVLQFDVDGDKSLVVSDKTLIDVAKRNIEKYDIVPLYYNMRKAEPVILNNESIYAGLHAAFVGGNIGIYSNNISKIWNSDVFIDGTMDERKEAIDLIRILCCENNFVIDYAKTLYKPTRPDDMNDKINAFTNNPLPHFFKYAKDKKDSQVCESNKSFVNKLESLIPNPRINFRKLGIGDIDYRLMMKNPDIEFDVSISDNGKLIKEETNPVIVEYCNFDKSYYLSVDNTICSGKIDKSDSYMKSRLKNSRIVDEIKLSMSGLGYDEDDIVDILVKYLYGIRKSANKTALWLCYGDIIYRNLEKHIKKKTKVVQCVDCGEWIEVSTKDNETCRCEECTKEHKRELARIRKQRQRERQKSLLSRAQSD